MQGKKGGKDETWCRSKGIIIYGCQKEIYLTKGGFKEKMRGGGGAEGVGILRHKF